MVLVVLMGIDGPVRVCWVGFWGGGGGGEPAVMGCMQMLPETENTYF